MSLPLSPSSDELDREYLFKVIDDRLKNAKAANAQRANEKAQLLRGLKKIK